MVHRTWSGLSNCGVLRSSSSLSEFFCDGHSYPSVWCFFHWPKNEFLYGTLHSWTLPINCRAAPQVPFISFHLGVNWWWTAAHVYHPRHYSPPILWFQMCEFIPYIHHGDSGGCFSEEILYNGLGHISMFTGLPQFWMEHPLVSPNMVIKLCRNGKMHSTCKFTAGTMIELNQGFPAKFHYQGVYQAWPR